MSTATTPPDSNVEAAFNAAKRTVSFTSVKLGSPVHDADPTAHALPPDDPSIVTVEVDGIVSGSVQVAIGDEFLERLAYSAKCEGVIDALRPTVEALVKAFQPLGDVRTGEPAEADRASWPGEAPMIVSCSLSSDDEVVMVFTLALTYHAATATKHRVHEDEGEVIAVPTRPHAEAGVTVLDPAMSAELQRLGEIEVELSAVLGETGIPLQEVLGWLPGSIVLLGRSAGEPADLRVDRTTIARGDVVAIEEMYGVRINELVMGRPARPAGVSRL